ncbi:hypothetical protein K7X08_010525 [Anisodus acutangulus]|uniref:RNase H type-1 domain-containing protein n=1 Tax=Anisodus acutangulus TaxID=402998 RepID=A0A9Q1N7D2_9SOLA|nr:hypothetical protein K7X08_010525 [Anisodus acutangulus]
MSNATNSDVELAALLGGPNIAVLQNLHPLLVKIDSAVVISMITNNYDTNDTLRSECKYMMTRLGNPQIRHVYREQNKVADALALAKEGARRKVFGAMKLLIVPPVYANNCFWTDMGGTTFARKINVCNNSLSGHYGQNRSMTLANSNVP